MKHMQTFLELHHADELLFLGNAWDLLSALALERAGFKAIGTTSWGIASSLGARDGEQIDFATHLGIIRKIVDHVNIPVSADIEAGYSEDMATIVEHVLQTAHVGVAGINLEDSFKTHVGLRDLSQHCDLLSKIRVALDHNGFPDFFINARTDTYFQLQDPLHETITRAKAYVESGASGIFVPGLQAEKEIQAIAAEVAAPLNILSLPGLTRCEKLQSLGVKRFSFGNAFSDKVLEFVGSCAQRLHEARDTSFFYEDGTGVR